MARLLLMSILTAATFANVAVAGVELGDSQITSDAETVPAGTTVTVDVVLKNTGDKPSDKTDLRISFPQNGFFVKIDELPGLKRDDNEREVTARLNIPAGGEYRFSFVLLASRSEVGHELSSNIEVLYLWDQVRWNSEFSTRITNAPSTAGVIIGGLRFHPAAGWLLGWLVCGGLMFVWIRARLQWVREHPKSHVVLADVRRMPPIGLALLVMGPLAFLIVSGGMAWRDLQTLTNWKEAQATILDRREDVKVTTVNEPGKRSRSSSTSTPEFALKYQAAEREVISSGFETGPSVHIGSQVIGKAEMDEWVAGRTIPCWYDPADPGNVVVRRGFRAASMIFGLPALPILWFGFRQLRKVGKAARQLDENEMQGGLI